MRGLITDRDLEQAEREFPGIGGFFAQLLPKPRTFLELVARFEHWGEERAAHCMQLSASDSTGGER